MTRQQLQEEFQRYKQAAEGMRRLIAFLQEHPVGEERKIQRLVNKLSVLLLAR